MVRLLLLLAELLYTGKIEVEEMYDTKSLKIEL